jgi:DNA repair exonuclease SbcCD ATPase subunit
MKLLLSYHLSWTMADLETLRRQAQIQETYEAHLLNSSANLLELVKKSKQKLDSTKAQADAAEQEKEQAHLDAKAAVSELGSNLSQLQQQCQKLSTSLCPTKPQLICQMPLNDLKASRRAVESNLKLFIVKQFHKVIFFYKFI